MCLNCPERQLYMLSAVVIWTCRRAVNKRSGKSTSFYVCYDVQANRHRLALNIVGLTHTVHASLLNRNEVIWSYFSPLAALVAHISEKRFSLKLYTDDELRVSTLYYWPRQHVTWPSPVNTCRGWRRETWGDRPRRWYLGSWGSCVFPVVSSLGQLSLLDVHSSSPVYFKDWKLVTTFFLSSFFFFGRLEEPKTFLHWYWLILSLEFLGPGLLSFLFLHIL